jgi:hypothetical protein
MGALLRALSRKGLRQGLTIGPGSRGWLVVGLAAGAAQWMRRKSGEPKASWSHKLEPGETLVVRRFRKGESPED